MFSWLLKLLGIEEDKPVSSNNSYLATKANKQADTSPEKAEEKKAEPAPTPDKEAEVATPTEVAEPEPEPKPEPKPKPKPEPKSEPEPEPKPEPESSDVSLADEYPDLKANFIKVLTEAGYTTRTSIDQAEDKELLALKGIGQATLKILRA